MRKAPVHDRLEGATLGGYRLLRRLDVSGLAAVYLAERRDPDGQRVALKVVRTEELLPTLPAEAREGAIARFLREAHVLSRFAHPNILPVYGGGIADGSLYLAMQYVSGGSLADAIRGRSPYPLRLPAMVPLVIELVSQLASALRYAHERGITHGAVRPSNALVQLGPNGDLHLLLADFGIARELVSRGEGARGAESAAYVAPEQIGGRAVPASDQYALAALAYQLLTRRMPFQGDATAQIFGRLHSTPPPARTFNRALPLEVSEALGRALVTDPRARFPSVTAFAEALRDAAREPEPILLAEGGPLEVGLESGAAPAAHPDGAQALVVASAAQSAESSAPAEQPEQALSGSSAPTMRHRSRRQRVSWIAAAALLAFALVAAIAAMRPQGMPQAVGPPARAAEPAASASASPSPSATATGTATPTAIESAATGDAATITQLTAPGAVRPGERFVVRVTFSNAGATTWTDGAGYRLVCDTLRHPRQNCPRNLEVNLAGLTIVPGRTIRFTLTLVAPGAPGTYQAWLNLSRQGALFPTADVDISVPVTQAAIVAPPLPQSPTPRPTTVPRPTATPHPTPTLTPPPPPPSPTPAPSPTPLPSPTQAPTAAPTPPEPTFTPQATQSPGA